MVFMFLGKKKIFDFYDIFEFLGKFMKKFGDNF